MAPRNDPQTPVVDIGVIEEDHRRGDRRGIVGDLDPVGVVLVERIGATDPRPLEAELLGEQLRTVVADQRLHRLRETGVIGPRLEWGGQVGEGLDPVDDVGVALPLDDRRVGAICVEHVPARLDPAARSPAHEAIDERLALLDDLGHLVGAEDVVADDVAVTVELVLLGGRQVVVDNAHVVTSHGVVAGVASNDSTAWRLGIDGSAPARVVASAPAELA